MTIPDGLSFIATLQKLEINDMPKSFKDRLDKGGPDFYRVQHVPSLLFQQCDLIHGAKVSALQLVQNLKEMTLKRCRILQVTKCLRLKDVVPVKSPGKRCVSDEEST
ncbi:putative disease resistance protein [Quercus suber]|uniref:Disease resistance protein n=1 Tax=Quercus suber TaxID=58331 RepID=A0AAW0LTM3_QUESU